MEYEVAGLAYNHAMNSSIFMARRLQACHNSIHSIGFQQIFKLLSLYQNYATTRVMANPQSSQLAEFSVYFMVVIRPTKKSTGAQINSFSAKHIAFRIKKLFLLFSLSLNQQRNLQPTTIKKNCQDIIKNSGSVTQLTKISLLRQAPDDDQMMVHMGAVPR